MFTHYAECQPGYKELRNADGFALMGLRNLWEF
jgi:hypothetical protein